MSSVAFGINYIHTVYTCPYTYLSDKFDKLKLSNNTKYSYLQFSGRQEESFANVRTSLHLNIIRFCDENLKMTTRSRYRKQGGKLHR